MTVYCLVCEEPIEGFDLIEAVKVNDGPDSTGYICATCWENRPDDMRDDEDEANDALHQTVIEDERRGAMADPAGLPTGEPW